MNDKIKELAVQAGYTPLPGFDFANSLHEVFMQKFAELIVRECAKVVSEKTGPRSALNVLEHFGFEE